MAQRQMATESPRTLQPTALVNEAYLRLIGATAVDFKNRCHFFAAAAKAMRRIRIDDARARNRLKRGGGRGRVPLGVADTAETQQDECDPELLLDLDEALGRLASLDTRMAEVVELRFFGGLTREQIGEALGIAPRTVDQIWAHGRTWLQRELSDKR